jgi:hypothetical protein
MLEAFEVGGEIFLSDFGGNNIALILEPGQDLSYSVIKLVNSSSDFTEINVSKSPFGKGHLNSTENPQNSPSFTINSVHKKKISIEPNQN